MKNKNNEECPLCEVSEETIGRLKKEKSESTKKKVKIGFLSLFKKKCPVCKMKLDDGEYYPKAFGKQFCSKQCREEYRRRRVKSSSTTGKGCH
jgi:YHS domain-containing protein